MPAGRPPKPIAKHILEGTYDKRRHAHRYEPKGEGRPVMPPEVAADPVAAESFQHTADALYEMGIATSLDSAAIAGQAILWSMLRRLWDKPNKTWHDYCNLVSLDKQWLQMADKLGMTPVGRARLGWAHAPKDDDPAAEFLR